MNTTRRWQLAAGAATLALAGLAIPAFAGGPGCPAAPSPTVALRSGGGMDARPVAGRPMFASPTPGASEVLVALPPGTVVMLPEPIGPMAMVRVAPPSMVPAVMLPPPGLTRTRLPGLRMPGLRMPGLRMIADMQAMMHRLTARMNALFAAPGAGPGAGARGWGRSPFGLLRAGFGLHAWAAGGPGTSVVMTAISNGPNSCAETVTYRAPAGGGKPIVKVSRVGNACAAIGPGGPGTTPAALLPGAPAHRPGVRPLPAGPRLIPADYRVRVMAPPAAPHS